MSSPRAPYVSRRLVLAVAAVLNVGLGSSNAASFTWNGTTTGLWTTGASWGGDAPTGTDQSDILTFAGDVGTTAYTSTNDFAPPFLLNQFVLQAVDSSGTAAITIAPQFSGQNIVALTGPVPQILQKGAGSVNFSVPIQLRADTTIGGSGNGVVTFNGAVSGAVDITKTGTSVFRFGTKSDGDLSENQWLGTLNLQGGIIRFNNNAVAGRTALRSNPVVTSAGATLSSTSEIRLGSLSGFGTVATIPTATPNMPNMDTESIVIQTSGNTMFGGSVSVGPVTGTGKADGSLTVRGPGTQTFIGSITMSSSDAKIGYGSTAVLAGTATLGNTSDPKGGIILNGGNFVLDNSGTNNNDRLRAAKDIDDTGLESVGGGKFTLIGNAAGTTETMARLQIGSVSNSGLSTARSGALSIQIVHTAAGAPTVLNFASYTRDTTTNTPATKQYTTVDFSAQNAAGAAIDLGLAGANPRIFFNGNGFAPLILGSTDVGTGVLNSTSANSTDAGWATVNGTHFATYGTNGIVATKTSTYPPLGTGGDVTANYHLTIDGISAGVNANTIELAPSVAGKKLTIGNGGTLASRGFVLGGTLDYTIGVSGANGTGALTGSETRYFHVKEATLKVDAVIAGTGALVKAGEGTLSLNNTGNSTNTSTVVINQGLVRASAASLPGGELRFRGGVLEVTGGGTFNRTVGVGNNTVNWNGFDGLSIDQDRGSGGFAANGGDLTVDLGGASQTTFVWEDAKFVNSGHALIFGSKTADRKVNWVDGLKLTAAVSTNYNAREIRVLDNPAVTTDRAQLSGTISGALQDDLLKTGAGILELSGANSYLGATLVHEGTLLVNGSNSTSFLTQVRSGATLGGTGTVGAVRVETNGILAPGEISGSSQAGAFQLNGDLKFAGAGAKLKFDLAAGAADQLKVNGSVFLQGAELVGSLLNGFLAAENDLFFLIINDGADAVQGTFAQGSSVTFGGEIFSISYEGDSVSNSFTGGNDVVLRAVPEPSTVLLLGSAIALFAGSRRRRKPSVI